MMTTTVYPVMRPLLPTVGTLAPYLERIDTSRWYTNHGPLVREFEERLAEHFGADPTQLVTSANATLALAQCLRAVGATPGTLCVMPSWTFVASAAAAVWAGLEPYFVDVDSQSWVLKPEEVHRIAAGRAVGAVMVVSAFGAPLDIGEWDAFTETTGIPVVVDAAGGFDAFRGNQGTWSHRSPLAVSLHATKVFGVGEGSVVLSSSESLAQRIRSYGNFGFEGDRIAELPGCNAKMNEYSAALGLAQFDQWPGTRERWIAMTSIFVEEIGSVADVQLAPGFGSSWVSSFGLIQLPPPIQALDVSKILLGKGIETRQWWGEGCHRQRAYRHYGQGTLTETERLGRQVLGLPFWLGLNREDVRAVSRALQDAIHELSARARPGARFQTG